MAAVARVDQIYAIGGYNGNDALSSAERFDLRIGSWSELPPMAEKRSGLAAVARDSKIYALGGSKKPFGDDPLSSAECLDVHTGSWSGLASMTEKRDGLAAVMLDSQIFAIGGECNDRVLGGDHYTHYPQFAVVGKIEEL